MKTQKFILVFGIVSLLFIISSPVFGQQSSTIGNTTITSNMNAFGQGSNVLNVGIGLGGYYSDIYGGYTSTPNFVISYDNGTFGNVGPGIISLGGLLSYKNAWYDYTSPYSGYYYNQSWSYFILGIRSAYHWNFTSNNRFDPYVGLMLGYYDISYKSTSNDPSYNSPISPYYDYYSNNYTSYLQLSLYLGARYYVSNNVGFWLEIGYGYSNAALGVSFKL